MINNGIWLQNNKECPKQSTIAVTGLGRSGTTMLARILGGLDIFMGDNLTPRSYEDKVIQIALKSKNIHEFSNICNMMNSKHDQWAFKSPGLRGCLPEACTQMRNARIIVIFRDVLSISLRNNLSMNAEVVASLEASILNYQKLVKAITSVENPILALSYEKCLSNPKNAIQQIAEFCGKNPTNEELDYLQTIVINGDPKYLKE